MRYDGGKGTCYAQLINLIPPHKRYIETHLGGGAVMRHKLPSVEQFGIDSDSTVIEMWKSQLQSRHWTVLHGDAIETLGRMRLDDETFVYSDPPYHPGTRRRARVYRHDYTVKDHENLLACLVKLPCKVMISGYTSPLYEATLASWSKHTFNTQTQAGRREECVWFNYPLPRVLHDDRYLGEGFRQREVIRRRQERLKQRVQKLSAVEQASLHKWLGSLLSQETPP